MTEIFRFLASFVGRALRILIGALIALFGAILGGTIGWILIIIGAVPFLAGMFDVCVFAPLFGLPFRGSKLRDAVAIHPPEGTPGA